LASAGSWAGAVLEAARGAARYGDPVGVMLEVVEAMARVVAESPPGEAAEALVEAPRYVSRVYSETGVPVTLALAARRLAPRLAREDPRSAASCLVEGARSYLARALDAVRGWCAGLGAAVVLPLGSVAYACYAGVRGSGGDALLASYERHAEIGEDELVRDPLFQRARAPRVPWLVAYQFMGGGRPPVLQASLVSPSLAVVAPGGEEVLLEARRRGWRPVVVTISPALTAASPVTGEEGLPRIKIRTPWALYEEHPVLDVVPAGLLEGAVVATESGPVALGPEHVGRAVEEAVRALEVMVLRSCTRSPQP